MSREKQCSKCRQTAVRGYSLCALHLEAQEQEERFEFENRIDVIMLNAVENLDGLKDWIKEYLIK